MNTSSSSSPLILRNVVVVLVFRTVGSVVAHGSSHWSVDGWLHGFHRLVRRLHAVVIVDGLHPSAHGRLVRLSARSSSALVRPSSFVSLRSNRVSVLLGWSSNRSSTKAKVTRSFRSPSDSFWTKCRWKVNSTTRLPFLPRCCSSGHSLVAFELSFDLHSTISFPSTHFIYAPSFVRSFVRLCACR